jgi:hypothetical protein
MTSDDEKTLRVQEPVSEVPTEPAPQVVSKQSAPRLVANEFTVPPEWVGPAPKPAQDTERMDKLPFDPSKVRVATLERDEEPSPLEPVSITTPKPRSRSTVVLVGVVALLVLGGTVAFLYRARSAPSVASVTPATADPEPSLPRAKPEPSPAPPSTSTPSIEVEKPAPTSSTPRSHPKPTSKQPIPKAAGGTDSVGPIY